MPGLRRVEYAGRDGRAGAGEVAFGGGERRDAGQAVPLLSVTRDDLPRLPLSIGELNRVLGGGIVPGSCVLVGGEPGVGKSTLLLAMAADVAKSTGSVLYVSAEESAHQIGRRAARMGIREERLLVLSEITVEAIVDQIEALRPALVIVDSVQAIYAGTSASAAGTVSQVRDCAAALLRVAKAQNVPVFLVGHVTKEGAIAGPKVLEHMVDAVLQLEGERFHAFRLLRSVKNRFGSTNEVGVFEMNEQGMVEVRNPSELFLAERLPNATGSAIAVSMEGTRPLLVEVQALSSTTAFSLPRRTGNGVDQNRLLLLTAVLSKRVGMDLSDQDIFVNVVGGMPWTNRRRTCRSRVRSPAASATARLGGPGDRRRSRVERRTAQRGAPGAAAARGDQAGIFAGAHATQHAAAAGGDSLPKGIEVIGVRTLYEALDVALTK